MVPFKPGDVLRVAGPLKATDKTFYPIGSMLTLLKHLGRGWWRALDVYGIDTWNVNSLFAEGLLTLYVSRKKPTQRGRPPRGPRVATKGPQAPLGRPKRV